MKPTKSCNTCKHYRKDWLSFIFRRITGDNFDRCMCTHIPEEQIYDIVDQIQRKIHLMQFIMQSISVLIYKMIKELGWALATGLITCYNT